jgi:hypothetical protein
MSPPEHVTASTTYNHPKQCTIPWSRGSRDRRRQSVGPVQSCTSSGVQWTSGRGGVCVCGGGGGGRTYPGGVGPPAPAPPRRRRSLAATTRTARRDPEEGVSHSSSLPSRGDGTPDPSTLHAGARPPSTAGRSRRCGVHEGGGGGTARSYRRGTDSPTRRRGWKVKRGDWGLSCWTTSLPPLRSTSVVVGGSPRGISVLEKKTDVP